MSKLLNKLVKISCCHWPALRDMYLHNWPQNMVGFYTVDNYIKWVERKPSLTENGNFQFFSLNGNWQDGTFIVAVSSMFQTP